jgi:hypothetical protein
MARTEITATVVYQNLEGGFWGLEDENGNNYLPVNMPEQLKYEGKKVKLVIREADAAGTAMWGRPVRIVSFSTMTP